MRALRPGRFRVEPCSRARRNGGDSRSPKNLDQKLEREMSEPKESPTILGLTFVEAFSPDFLRDPESVSPGWRQYFESIRESNGFASRPQLDPSSPRRR